jgi:hypothetical protein
LIEPGNRIQLPADWVKALGLQGQVALDKTPDGILVRPSPPVTWDDVFATKLPISHGTTDLPEVEVSNHDYFL